MAEGGTGDSYPSSQSEAQQADSNTSDNFYINNSFLMGNVLKKADIVESEVNSEKTVVSTNKNEQDLTAGLKESKLTVEGCMGKVEQTVRSASPGVKLLASQFENQCLQNTEKQEPKMPAFVGTQVLTPASRKGTGEPFVYALAKDVPEVPADQSTNCVKCRSPATICFDGDTQSNGNDEKGPSLNNQQQTSNMKNNMQSQVKDLSEELRQKLDLRNAENDQNRRRLSNERLLDVINELGDSHDRERDSTLEPESFLEQTIYDSVCDTSSVSMKDFEVISAISTDTPKKSPTSDKSSRSGRSKHSKKLLSEGANNDWKRKEAKRKSRTLKRSPKTENPFTQHSKFEDPHRGALPEAERDDGILEAMNPFHLINDDSGSNISDFTDSSFDSSDSEKSDMEFRFRESYSNKPLPPEPAKNKVVRDLRQLIYRGEADDEDKIALEKVNLRRKRESPALPEAPSDLSPNQIKLRGVLQSLVDSEKNYITSLDRLVKAYRDPIQQQFGIRKQEVVVTFNKVEELLQIHQMFQIELGDKLSNWTADERIGNTFHLFTGNMVLDIYSEYVNNYEAASELIKEVSNTKQAFRDFLKEKQMSSSDRLSLPGLMLKPIQRFPQFIMIIKDLLKYTPRDHHDRVPLQEALTGMENVAHQLNERKRQSEQYFHGHQIVSKLTPRLHPEKKMFLIRQDDVEQLAQDPTGQNNVKQRRLFLMNDKLISVYVTQKEQNDGLAERFTFKWQQSLSELELTTSAITPNMQTTVHKDSTTILSPKLEHTSEDPYSLATDLTDMVHDINLLAQIQMLVSALRHSYSKLNEDLLHELMTNLQKDIQGVDYHLQLLNSSSIILNDKARKKKYVFSAANASIKQEWCIDFLLAKYALDVVNIPSWHKQEFVGLQPALLMKHLSVDMQRTFTRVKCAVPVYFPTRNEGTVEHLWVCCSTETLTQVSIVSLHTARPALIESFQAAAAEIVCAENVPGYAFNTSAKTAFADDTVWMSTTDSEILVFMLSERDMALHRKPVHVFKQSSVVLCMLYLDDRVFCGSRSGSVVVFNRNDFGEWELSTRLMLATGMVKSIICVNDTLWVACGPIVHIVDSETNQILDTVSHHQSEEVHFNCMVKAGVGVWVSYIGKSNISLYHVETKHHLQDLSIGNAINDFTSVHSGSKDTSKNYEVTSLMASLGLLWIGTDIGVVLTYPLPRLRDGVPRINQRPSVALHGHNRAVQLIIPVHYGPISGSPVKRRPSEILKKSKVTQSVIQRLPKLDEVGRPPSDDSHKYLSLDSDAMREQNECDNVYEPVDTSRFEQTKLQANSNRESDIYEEMSSLCEDLNSPIAKENCELGETVGNIEGATVDAVTEEAVLTTGDLGGAFGKVNSNFNKERNKNDRSVNMNGSNVTEDAGNPAVQDEDDTDIRSSGEHTYFVLVKQDDKGINREQDTNKESVYADMTNSSFRREHSDDMDVLMKPKSSAMPETEQISFRSELKNKLKNRKSMENLADRDVNKEEVGRLYETLMRPQTTIGTSLSYQNSLSSQHSNESRSEMLYMRPNYVNPIMPQKPNYAVLNRKAVKQDSVKQKRQAKAGMMPEQKSQISLTNKSKVVSSFSSGTGLDTLRKQDSNTILVLTGGDGYKDWKKRQSLQSYRPEEPSLVFWLYKF